MKLLKAMRDFFLQCGTDKTYYIALSGGLDSSVLLSLSHAMRNELQLNLQAIHINHNLSQHSKSWSIHCKKICDELRVELIEHHIQLDEKLGESLENLARLKRYELFAHHIKKNSILLTAHHLDDQAETFLLQLCRGAGPKGLAAMPSIKAFGLGMHARPLLSFLRDDLTDYAMEKKLTWVEDESNQQQIFSRNFIRHEILCKLKSRWPHIQALIARSARHCAENQLLLAAFIEDDYENAKGSRDNTLSVKKILQLTAEKQRLVLRTWIQKLNFSLPNTKKLLNIQQQILLAAKDKMPCVRWKGVVLRRYRDDIFIMHDKKKNKIKKNFSWDMRQPLQLDNLGYLHSQSILGKGLAQHVGSVKICFRHGGEKIEMPARGGKHSLKKLFQEWGVLPWERDFIPLIYDEEKLIGLVGFYLNENYAVKDKEWGRVLFIESDI